MKDFFDHSFEPRMRPRTLDEFVGQEDIVGPGPLLRRAFETDRMLFARRPRFFFSASVVPDDAFHPRRLIPSKAAVL